MFQANQTGQQARCQEVRETMGHSESKVSCKLGKEWFETWDENYGPEMEISFISQVAEEPNGERHSTLKPERKTDVFISDG